MAGQSREHMASIAPLGAAARWPNGPSDMTAEAQKARARSAVKRALNAGVLTRPGECSQCGCAPQTSDGRAGIHAHHHKGYDHPLDVEWLCPKCHFRHDPRASKEANGRAKLTQEQVAEIRARYRPGATWRNPEGGAKTLAREFGVHGATIQRIVRNQCWIDAALSE